MRVSIELGDLRELSKHALHQTPGADKVINSIAGSVVPITTGDWKVRKQHREETRAELSGLVLRWKRSQNTDNGGTPETVEKRDQARVRDPIAYMDLSPEQETAVRQVRGLYEKFTLILGSKARSNDLMIVDGSRNVNRTPGDNLSWYDEWLRCEVYKPWLEYLRQTPFQTGKGAPKTPEMSEVVMDVLINLAPVSDWASDLEIRKGTVSKRFKKALDDWCKRCDEAEPLQENYQEDTR